jgi:hypothetical protein
MAEDIKKINEEINKLRAELGKKPLQPFDIKDLETAKALFSALGAEVREMSSDLDYVAKSFKDSVNELSNQKAYLSDAKKAFSSISSISEKILDYRRGESTLNEKQLKDLQKQAKKRFEELQLIKDVGNLSQANRLEIIEGLKQQEKFNDSIERTIKHQKDVNKEIGIVGMGIGGIAKAASKLGFGDLSQPLTEAIEKTKNARLQMKLNADEVKNINRLQELQNKNYDDLTLAEIEQYDKLATIYGMDEQAQNQKRASIQSQNKELSTQTSKYRNIGNALKDQLTKANLIDFAIKEFVDALINGDKATGELAKGFNMSYSAASNLRKDLATTAALSNDVNVSIAGLQQSMMAVGKTLGSNVQLNKEDLITFTKLREQSGMTNENLAAMQRFTLVTGGTLEGNTKEFLAQAQVTAQNNGVVLNTKQLLEETANVSDAIKLSAGGTAGGFAKAAATVKSLGMSLEKVDDIANSLLDFESSITSELEAELLVGKDLTLEKARQAALNGDLATVAEEIATQVGTAADFTAKNRIQQEALAKAVGMSREDLAKTLVEREALVGLSGEEAKAGKEAFDSLVKRYDVETATKMIREKGFKTLMDQQSIQERFNKGIEKLRDTLMGLAQPVLDILSPLMDIVNVILPAINFLLSPIIEGFRVIGVAINYLKEGWGAFTNMLEPIMPVLKGIGIAVLAVLSPLIALAAAAAFVALAGIPVVGPVLAAAAAIGAISFLTSKIAGIKIEDGMIGPDGGLVVSGKKGTYQLDKNDTVIAGTDLGGQNREISRSITSNENNKPSRSITSNENNKPKGVFESIGDLLTPSVNVDLTPVVAELQSVRAVLNQILAKEGSVYIDSTKAGTAFAVGTSKLQ